MVSTNGHDQTHNHKKICWHNAHPPFLLTRSHLPKNKIAHWSSGDSQLLRSLADSNRINVNNIDGKYLWKISQLSPTAIARVTARRKTAVQRLRRKFWELHYELEHQGLRRTEQGENFFHFFRFTQILL